MKKTLVVFMVIILAVSLAACSGSGKGEVMLTVKADTPPDPVFCPLTNVIFGQEINARPILVSIDNHPDARPHYGISQADIVYEVPAEGNIPRLLGLFYSQVPEKIGPVRSARPYIVDVAREWDAVMVHCGGSSDALNYLRQGHVDDMDEIAWSRYFWRDDDSSRWAPHNLLTSKENIYAYLEYRERPVVDEDVRQMDFLDFGEEAQGESVDWINVRFTVADNYYIYDSKTGYYTRKIDDDIYIDAATGEALEISNIIVQKVSSWLVDSKHLGIDLTAGGEAWLFTGGTMVKGTWSRADLNSPTIFTDSNGEVFRLNTGQTWIEVINQSVSFDYKNTQAGS